MKRRTNVSTKEEMCAAIDKVAKIIGRRPTMSEYRKHYTEDMPDADTIRRHFGGWLEAVEAAGYNPKRSRKLTHHTDAELIEDLNKVSKKLGYVPDQNGYDAHRERGMASSVTYARHFGSWPEAIEKAGLNYAERTFTKEEVIEAVIHVKKILGRAFTQKEYDAYRDPDMPCSGTVKIHLGNWKAAMNEVGQKPLTHYDHYTDEEIIRILRDVAELLGHTPSTCEYLERRSKCYPWDVTISARFGTWGKAVTAAGLPPVGHSLH